MKMESQSEISRRQFFEMVLLRLGLSDDLRPSDGALDTVPSPTDQQERRVPGPQLPGAKRESKI